MTRSLVSDAVECAKVLALSNRRGSAPEVQKLNCETDESRQRQKTIAAQLKPQPFHFKVKPTNLG